MKNTLLDNSLVWLKINDLINMKYYKYQSTFFSFTNRHFLFVFFLLLALFGTISCFVFISVRQQDVRQQVNFVRRNGQQLLLNGRPFRFVGVRSEEHTSELQSQSNLVCRLL